MEEYRILPGLDLFGDRISPDLQPLVESIISGIRALAARVSNMDSNSIGGIRVPGELFPCTSVFLERKYSHYFAVWANSIFLVL